MDRKYKGFGSDALMMAACSNLLPIWINQWSPGLVICTHRNPIQCTLYLCIRYCRCLCRCGNSISPQLYAGPLASSPVKIGVAEFSKPMRLMSNEHAFAPSGEQKVKLFGWQSVTPKRVTLDQSFVAEPCALLNVAVKVGD